MKKAIAAILAITMCAAFSSCEKSDSGSTAQAESLTDLIESETEETLSETEFAAVQISETQTETFSETNAETSGISETEAAVTFGDFSEKISNFNMTVTYPSVDGKRAEALFYNISAVSSRLYRVTAGEAGGSSTFAYVTDNQASEILEAVQSMTANTSDSAADSNSSCCEITGEYADGTALNSLWSGDIPEGISGIAEKIQKLAETDFDDEKFNNMHSDIQYGIDMSVNVYACLFSNLDRYGKRDGDAALYAGKTLILKSRDEVNAAADLLENEPVMPISEDWHGYALVKFGEDGAIEYVNWAEEESGLSENRLTYDDCTAYYIENGSIIASNNFERID